MFIVLIVFVFLNCLAWVMKINPKKNVDSICYFADRCYYANLEYQWYVNVLINLNVQPYHLYTEREMDRYGSNLDLYIATKLSVKCFPVSFLLLLLFETSGNPKSLRFTF